MFEVIGRPCSKRSTGLCKRFGGFTAVSNVSFRVAPVEILGLIGPNGSGKSTIFNMLSGNLGAECRVDPLSRPRDCRPPTAPHHQPGDRPHLPDPEAVPAAILGRQCRARRVLRPGAAFAWRRAFEAAEKALALVGLLCDRTIPVAGLPGAAGSEKARIGQGARHRADPVARRRKPSVGSTTPRWIRRPTCCGASAANSASPNTWVEHIMGVLMRVVDRGHGPRSRREDRRGPAGRGRRRSAGDRGLSRNRRCRRAQAAARRAWNLEGLTARGAHGGLMLELGAVDAGL